MKNSVGNYKILLILIGLVALVFILPEREDVNAESYILSKMADCTYNQNYSSSCYSKISDDFTARFSLREILDTFQKNEKLTEIFSHCHEVTHYLSRNEYEKVGNIPDVYAECTEACHGGCYHGALESHFMKKGIPLYSDDSVILNEVRDVCETPQEHSYQRIYDECVHGIGHAMMFITNGDLPYSLKLCDGLNSIKDREGCYSGVFMESSSSSTSRDHPGKFVNPDDPMYPCNILEERYLKLCYTYQSSYFSIITRYDWEKTIDLCNQVPELYRNGCFMIVGSNQVGYTQNFTVMKEDCYLIEELEMRKRCVQGVVSGLSGRYGGNESMVIEFCSIVDVQDKEICYKEMAFQVSVWSRNEQELIDKCRKIPEEEFETTCEETLKSRNQ